MSEEAVKSFMKAQQETASEWVKTAHEILVVQPSKVLAVLPEEIFVQSFLPYFCGERDITLEPKVLPSWISVAGSPTKAVQIIDSDNNPLFVVPPIADSTDIDVLNKQQGQAFINILKNYWMHKDHIPVIGENYIVKAMNNRFESLKKTSENHTEYEKQWEEIFSRYGKSKKDAEVNKVDDGKLDPDEFEYE